MKKLFSINDIQNFSIEEIWDLYRKYVNNYINEMSKIFRNLNLKLKKINEHKD